MADVCSAECIYRLGAFVIVLVKAYGIFLLTCGFVLVGGIAFEAASKRLRKKDRADG